LIGINTNVLARYIVQDDKKQSAIATEYIENNINENNPGFINVIVLCELDWILKRAYGYDRTIRKKVFEQILMTREFIIEKSDIVREAITEFAGSNLDLADCLIGFINRNNGCRASVTFDKKAAKQANFIHLQ
jgi:predicted nucleic-acid-binding protein